MAYLIRALQSFAMNLCLGVRLLLLGSLELVYCELRCAGGHKEEQTRSGVSRQPLPLLPLRALCADAIDHNGVCCSDLQAGVAETEVEKEWQRMI